MKPAPAHKALLPALFAQLLLLLLLLVVVLRQEFLIWQGSHGHMHCAAWG